MDSEKDVIGPWVEASPDFWMRSSVGSIEDARAEVDSGDWQVWDRGVYRAHAEGHGTRRDADLALLKHFPNAVLEGGVYGESEVAAQPATDDPTDALRLAGEAYVAAEVEQLRTWQAHNAACERNRTAKQAWEAAIKTCAEEMERRRK